MGKAIYPGTFDPVTLGHLDLIKRAAGVFDTLIVGVGENPAKKTLFTNTERVTMLRKETASLPNVTVAGFKGLLVDLAAREGVSILVRGVRSMSDFEYELQMAVANRQSAGVETLFMSPSPEYACVSARLIKELASEGGDVSAFISPAVARRLAAKLARKRGKK